MPVISFIVSTRDRPALLREAVCSVLHHTLSDFECVDVDDGSVEHLELPAYPWIPSHPPEQRRCVPCVQRRASALLQVVDHRPAIGRNDGSPGVLHGAFASRPAGAASMNGTEPADRGSRT
jgi:hypothetical protein